MKFWVSLNGLQSVTLIQRPKIEGKTTKTAKRIRNGRRKR
jgi:hypothetical protein